MKKLFILFISCLALQTVFAQKETFDITTYTAPDKWKKETSASSIQFTKEDKANGSYCIIMLFKALPAAATTKESFDLTWTSVLKEMVTINSAPEMQPPATDDGWEALSGYAPFEKEGDKGIAVLVTSSGFEKMVNIIIFTNTDAYEKDITAFLESVDIKKPAAQNSNTNAAAATAAKQKNIPSSQKSGFTFTTTNFDDGWTSTVQEDWVQVIKGGIKTLIHYPNAKADAYNSCFKRRRLYCLEYTGGAPLQQYEKF